jgi:hypothetical protein
MVHGASGVRFADNFRAIPTGNINIGREFAESQRERTANEAGAKDGHALD